MNQNYEYVPDIITGKDLDYLSDMFNWNYGAFKKCSNYVENIQDLEAKSLVEKATNTFDSNMNTVLSILQNGG